MALTFLGETDFRQSGLEQWQQSLFDLDSLVVPYSGSIVNLNSFLDALAIGQESDIDANMLLVDWRVGGSKVYPSVDLMYTGKKNGILPPVKHEYDDAVMSASSGRRSNGGSLSSPLTLQYYAPTTQVSFITYDDPGERGTAADPADDIRAISITVGDTSYSPTGLLSDVITSFFSELIINTIQSIEIVPDRIWTNVERKAKTLVPYLFSIAGGNYMAMHTAGNGYSPGDALTVSDGTYSAAITVTSVSLTGVIGGYSVVSNTFNYNTTSPIPASGGTGSGATFDNIHVG